MQKQSSNDAEIEKRSFSFTFSSPLSTQSSVMTDRCFEGHLEVKVKIIIGHLKVTSERAE